jgi:hypothetical protein
MVNFRSEGGYFLMPWSFGEWQAVAGADGAANVSVDSSLFPPAEYTVAFHCDPECPGGDLKAGDLVGGEPWTGDILLSSRLTIQPGVSANLTVTSVQEDVLQVAGTEFGPDQAMRVVVVPNLRNFDGPPIEASMVTYPVSDAQGAFTIDVDISGFPAGQRPTQVVVFDVADSTAIEVPLTSTMFVPEE